jgi:hypothetical protein
MKFPRAKGEESSPRGVGGSQAGGVSGVVPLDFDVVCEGLEARDAAEEGRGIEKRLKPGPLLTQRPAEVVHEGVACSAILGALTMGCIGFLFGFFGPIIFTPQSDQGPLLGSFITDR